jgi:hypothetical protein
MWVAAAKLQTLRSKFKQISGSQGEYEDDSFPEYIPENYHLQV